MSCSYWPNDGGQSTQDGGQDSRESRKEQTCLEGLLLANDPHLYVLIRYASGRLCAAPGGHGHSPPQTSLPRASLPALPLCHRGSHLPSCTCIGGKEIKHLPFLSFQTQQLYLDTALMNRGLRLSKPCRIRPECSEMFIFPVFFYIMFTFCIRRPP